MSFQESKETRMPQKRVPVGAGQGDIVLIFVGQRDTKYTLYWQEHQQGGYMLIRMASQAGFGAHACHHSIREGSHIVRPHL